MPRKKDQNNEEPKTTTTPDNVQEDVTEPETPSLEEEEPDTESFSPEENGNEEDMEEDPLKEEEADVVAVEDDADDDYADTETENLSSDEIDEVILAMRNTSRKGARVEKMSKAQKKEMYASEHVITESGTTEIETVSTQKKAEYVELVASQKSKRILSGILTGCHYANPDDKASTILAEISYGNGFFPIVIPSYLLFDYETSDKNETHEQKLEQNKQIEQIINRRLMARIKFVVRTIDKQNTVWADRLMAMDIEGSINYRSKTAAKPRITPGLLVKGTIVFTSKRSVIVEALGAEVMIPYEELSYRHVGNAREEFHVGDDQIVRILSVSPYKVKKQGSNEYTLINATGSIKSIAPDRTQEYYDSIREGGVYACEVTWVEDDVFVLVAGKMDALVAFPKTGKVPERGETRIMRVTGKDDSKKRIFGVFVNN